MNEDKQPAVASPSESGCVWVFEVNSHGTLFEADFVEPKTRLDAFEVWTGFFASANSVLSAMECCEPLRWKVASIYEDRGSPVVAGNERKRKGRKKTADPDEALRRWLEQMAPEEFEVAIRSPLEQWANEAPDWCYERDYIPTAQGAAMRYFESEPDACDLLDVCIVEGEHPGSTFYAAVLEGDVDSANDAARKADLAIRFVREGSAFREQ